MSDASRTTQFKAGNQSWKARKSHGRKPLFEGPDQLRNACISYFQWCDDNPLIHHEVVKYRGKAKLFEVPRMRPYTVIGMCSHLNISRQSWTEYRRKPDFSDTCDWVERVIYVQKFDGAVAGIFNAGIIGREIRPYLFG